MKTFGVVTVHTPLLHLGPCVSVCVRHVTLALNHLALPVELLAPNSLPTHPLHPAVRRDSS